jgi:amidophosphoribosyltransferase
LTTLDRLNPKRIVIVSSAPQIRYPDCYGIDMSRMKEFVAFRAAISLLQDRKMEHTLDQIYEQCKEQPDHAVNFVKQVYALFSEEEISGKVAQIVTTSEIKAEVKVIFQTVDNLHRCIPEHRGDWYFTGDYPTTGGTRVVNKAFVNYMEGKTVRAY